MNILLPEQPSDLLVMFERREVLESLKNRTDLKKLKGQVLKKLLLGKRIEGVGGNAAVHRQVLRALSGAKRKLTIWRAFVSIIRYNCRNRGVNEICIQEKKFYSEYQYYLEGGHQLRPWARLTTAFEGQIETARPRLAQAILRLEDEDRRLANLAAAQDTDGFLAALESCEHAECVTIQKVARQIRSAKKPIDLVSFRYPLCVLTILFLVALYVHEDERGSGIDLSEIMPKKISDGRLVRPMTRWMQCVKKTGEFVSQTEVSYLLVGKCEDAKRQGQRLWNGEVATHGQFEKILSNLARTGNFSQLDKLSLQNSANFIPIIENLLMISEDYSKQNPWFSELYPFCDFRKLQSLATMTGVSIAS